jgi:hypothetical protein
MNRIVLWPMVVIKVAFSIKRRLGRRGIVVFEPVVFADVLLKPTIQVCI